MNKIQQVTNSSTAKQEKKARRAWQLSTIMPIVSMEKSFT